MVYPVISICLCTYHRLTSLDACLRSLLNLDSPGLFEVIVVDNDSAASAEAVLKGVDQEFRNKGINYHYAVEPQQGISSARNRSIAMASGVYVAFIDDDETVEAAWLCKLLGILNEYEADGVFGPVLPIFPEGFPAWQKPLLFRRRRPSGMPLKEKGMATGNALVRREILERRKGPFDTRLNKTGGSDSDLFCWLSAQGARFVWCDEGIVREVQPLERAKIAWHLRRAYRGGWGFSFRKTWQMGYCRALALVSVWVLPAAINNILRSLSARDVRTIGLLFLKEIATQCGKLGFFFGGKVEEYKGL